MIASPTGDNPCFAAEEPDRCHDCFRLIQPGEADFLRTTQAYLSEACPRRRH